MWKMLCETKAAQRRAAFISFVCRGRPTQRRSEASALTAPPPGTLFRQLPSPVVFCGFREPLIQQLQREHLQDVLPAKPVGYQVKDVPAQSITGVDSVADTRDEAGLDEHSQMPRDCASVAWQLAREILSAQSLCARQGTNHEAARTVSERPECKIQIRGTLHPPSLCVFTLTQPGERDQYQTLTSQTVVRSRAITTVNLLLARENPPCTAAPLPRVRSP